MVEPANRYAGAVVPVLLYRDAGAAVAWLVQAFGCGTHLLVHGRDGGVVHAELSLGSGMVMVGPARDSDYGSFFRAPAQIGAVTAAIYAVVADADAHYARAKAAGAEIVMEIKDEDYGGRSYTCRDPEGHLWTFGTYTP
ncbi:MAG: glyoxalase [Azospirillum sp.]|nr:glyoxalase [Azospirillum sp.]